MKKIFLTFALVLLLLSPLILSDTASSLNSALDQNVEKAQAISDSLEKSQDTQYWEEKWDYLGTEWKAIFLKNPVVAEFDAVFTSISIVFEIFFGIPYSLSFLFLGVFILWVFFFLNLRRIVSVLEFSAGSGSKSFSFSGGMSYVGSAMLCVILAQFKLFEGIVSLLGRLAFSPEYVWTRLIVLVVIFLGFGVLSFLDRKLAAYIRLKRKVAKEKTADVSRKTIDAFAKNLLNNSK